MALIISLLNSQSADDGTVVRTRPFRHLSVGLSGPPDVLNALVLINANVVVDHSSGVAGGSVPLPHKAIDQVVTVVVPPVVSNDDILFSISPELLEIEDSYETFVREKERRLFLLTWNPINLEILSIS